MKRLFAAFLTCAILPCVGLTAQAETKPKTEKALAQYLVTVTDDFIVDVYRNGERVPDARRKLLVERFGATVERIDVPVNPGDWVVFNVVNNRLRWGGAYYFAVAGVKRDETSVGFASELDSGDWSCCDNPSNVTRFISDRDFLSANTAHRVQRPWHEGDQIMQRHVPQWSGTAVWGTTRNTWIKFIAR